jgi:hypothetical protein
MTATPKKARRIPVTDGNLKKAALRLLDQTLVSTEVQYVKHVLGASATQLVIDETVVAVREMPWTSIVIPE